MTELENTGSNALSSANPTFAGQAATNDTLTSPLPEQTDVVQGKHAQVKQKPLLEMAWNR